MGTNRINTIIMKTTITRKSSPLKLVLVLIWFVISGLILAEGLGKNDNMVADGGKYDSLKTSIESKKSLIVNTYLIGVSIYQEAVE